MGIKRVLWGIFFIAAAVLVVINQLGVDIGINLWGLFVTVLVVPIVANGLYCRNYFNVFFGIGVWLIVFARPLGIADLAPWTILTAALFLSIGFSILVKPQKRMGHAHGWGHFRDQRRADHWGYETVDHVEGNEVNCYVSLSGSCKYLHSDNLARGRVECRLGYLKVYFDHVRLHPDGATVYVDCALGNMELCLPRDWQVLINIDNVLGNVSEQPHTNPGNGPVLRLNGSVKLGNIDIAYIDVHER